MIRCVSSRPTVGNAYRYQSLRRSGDWGHEPMQIELTAARFKEEVHAGLKTGIIRAMGGSGSVVTSAGLVFAFTMMAVVISDLRVIGQVGTTIGLGLLFDTLVVRSL